MGLFGWLRRPKPGAPPSRQEGVPLPQLCYDVAYFILPHYAYHDLGKLADLCLNSPAAAWPFFYVMSCQVRKVEPDVADARRFRCHHGQLDGRREYFALEYPSPPPIDLSAVPPEQIGGGGAPFVLAPHFSAILREHGSGEVDYYVLGQAPRGGGTTLRCVLREGMNCNLGPGPAPQLPAFLEAIRRRAAP
jgi:hypothetical protein